MGVHWYSWIAVKRPIIENFETNVTQYTPIIVSPKIGDTMDHARSSSMYASTEIFCDHPTSRISFWISLNFSSGLL